MLATVVALCTAFYLTRAELSRIETKLATVLAIPRLTLFTSNPTKHVYSISSQVGISGELVAMQEFDSPMAIARLLDPKTGRILATDEGKVDENGIFAMTLAHEEFDPISKKITLKPGFFPVLVQVMGW